MNEAFFLVRRHKNMYMDISGIPPQKLLEYFPRMKTSQTRCFGEQTGPAPACGNQGNIEKFNAAAHRSQKQSAKSCTTTQRACSPLTELRPAPDVLIDHLANYCFLIYSDRSACITSTEQPAQPGTAEATTAAASNTSADTSTGNTLGCGRQEYTRQPREQKTYPNAAPQQHRPQPSPHPAQ